MCPALSDDELRTAIDQCAAEPIHIPGTVQPFGCLVAIDPKSGTVQYASENCEEFLGMSCEALLGQDFQEVMGRDVSHDVQNSISLSIAQDTAKAAGVHEIGGRELALRTFASQGFHIVEFEENRMARFSAPDALKNLNYLMTSIQKCDDEDEMLGLTAKLMRHLSGFDRVMIYRFDEEFNGEVIAEDAHPDIEKMLGLRFPHWDIPEQARAIMHKIPIRFITDVDQVPVRLRASEKDALPLDISLAATRGVSPVHMEYLRNMKACSTMTLSVVIDDRLWGIISFQHRTPETPPPLLRELLVTFIDVFNKKLQTLHQKRKLEMITRVDDLKDDLLEKIDSKDGLDEAAPVLMDVLAADGLVIKTETGITTYGKTPEDTVIEHLFLEAEETPDELKSYVSLSSEFPHFANALKGCAGAITSTAGPERGFCVFRNEIAKQISWAGNPEKQVEEHDGKKRLSPRGSFSIYLERVVGRATPWSEQDFYFAERLWSLISFVERRILMSALNRQQDILIKELNHRVRNILALVRSISQQARSSSYGSLSSYTRAIEARIQALAASHNIASGSIISSVSIQRLIETEAAPYVLKDDQRIIVSGPTKYFRSDVAPIISLIFHELITNAVKYGALSNDTGTVLVRMKHENDGLQLRWQEIDGPPVIEPEQRGFGSTLIEHAVPHELNGTASLSFRKDGLRAEMFLPSDIVDEPPADTDVDPLLDPLPPPPELTETEGFAGLSALILEDNFVIATGMQMQLNELSLTDVSLVSETSSAMDFLDTNTPDIAILDVNLGREVTSEPIALHLLEREIPFMFVTGYGTNVDLDPRLSDIPRFTKPVSTETLRRGLKDLLKQVGP